MIKAKVVLDSVIGMERIITLMVEAPKFLDAEISKHRNIESNSSSSRALSFPSTKNQESGFVPPWIFEPANTMHGSKEVELSVYEAFEKAVKTLYKDAVDVFTPFKSKIHKQHLNRYVEPYMMQTKVMTGNEFAWRNFINLRKNEFADPNIQILAELVEEVIGESEPVIRRVHLPLVTEAEIRVIDVVELALVSAGRVAKVSYGQMLEEDRLTSITRAHMLIDHEHKTPFCHQIFQSTEKIDTGISHADVVYEYSGAIRGAVQLRKLIWRTLNEQEASKFWRSDLSDFRSNTSDI